MLFCSKQSKGPWDLVGLRRVCRGSVGYAPLLPYCSLFAIGRSSRQTEPLVGS